MDILVTNNPLVNEHFQGDFRVDFIDTDMLGILSYVRDLVHKGHRLLTHPLSGSVKPNETPYKSVIVKDIPDKSDLQTGAKIHVETDPQSVCIIEECIFTAQKFPSREIPKQYLNDMQIVDLSLISGAKGKH